MNPFQALYAQCHSGTAAEKLANLPDFPRMVDIELTNACNFRCKMCPTGNRKMTRPTGFMEAGTFKKIIDQCFLPGTAIRFIGWGEPTLHPQISGFVAEASSSLLLTHLNTNGSTMTPDLASRLVDAGLKSIKFSFQGTDEKTYAEMRDTDFYAGLIEAIDIMNIARTKKEMFPGGFTVIKAAPYISASTTTTYESPEMIEEFRQEVGPLVDELSVGTTIFGYLGEKQDENLSRFDPCPEIYTKLSIQWDGAVVLCCNDFDASIVLGNVNEKSISEIWRHESIEIYRENLAAGRYDNALCVDCWEYMA